MAKAFRFSLPFSGSFLLTALLVIGVAVPTPGAVGGFHEAFRVGVVTFFGAPGAAAVGAAIVLHLFSIGPALLFGVFFAAEAGLNLAGMRKLAHEAEPAAASPPPTTARDDADPAWDADRSEPTRRSVRR